MLIEPIKPENLANFSERFPRHILTRVCESSTHDFCVLPLRICKVKCYWPIRNGNRGNRSRARVRRGYFSAETRVCVRRLAGRQ